MSVRSKFHAELDSLKEMTLELGEMARRAVSQSIEALRTQNVDMALKVIEYDAHLNLLEEEINEKAILVIAKEAPVASDLRRVMVSIKTSSDLERVGDLAVNIAKAVIRIGHKDLVKPIEEIPKVAEFANQMVEDVLKAYSDEDVSHAKKVAEVDDQVDDAYGRLIRELLELMTEKPDYIAQITQLAFICRFVERVADHATNIAENVIYLVKGTRYDLND